MIQPNGTVKFDSPEVSISPDSTREDFLTSALFPMSKPLNQNSPWSRYSFGPVAAGGEQFAANICFRSDAIYTLSLCSTRPEFGTSWGDTSAGKEQARHCFHKRLLRDMFGRSPDEYVPLGPDKRDEDIGFNFPWGDVSASTDTKSYGSEILIRYAP